MLPSLRDELETTPWKSAQSLYHLPPAPSLPAPELAIKLQPNLCPGRQGFRLAHNKVSFALGLSTVHFCCYKENFLSLYCRLSAVIELDSLKAQQALREAIADSEVAAAKQRHQQVMDYIQVIVCS